MSEIFYESYEGCPDAALVEEVGGIADVVFGEDQRDLVGRLFGRRSVLIQLARLGGKPVAYKVGYEDREGRFISWLGGVLPEVRRQGIALELMRIQHRWAKDHDYEWVEMVSRNKYRPMLILALSEGFEIYGVRMSRNNQQLILLRKRLTS